MRALVIGGTRYMGIHVVNELLAGGHDVTIATSGKTGDGFGDKVRRKVIERHTEEGMSALRGGYYDVVIDNLAYSSNDMRYLLEAVRADKVVVTSSASVYDDWHLGMAEREIDTTTWPLRWGDQRDFEFDESKRQAEAALLRAYPAQASVAVRFPLVCGEDDYTKRLYFYVEHVLQGRAMHVDNPEARMALVHSREAARFLVWAAQNPIAGAVNVAGGGTVSLGEMVRHAEARSGKRAILREDGDEGPRNGVPDHSLDTAKACEAGFIFQDVASWIYPLIDAWVDDAGRL